ncbi:MAG TPA: LLM class F420-dependent oxidoreductase [Patescibacteria group bacterium]|nr:LLM class F420-dependent oxidoreductase [Patescibacteria group bacterium]
MKIGLQLNRFDYAGGAPAIGPTLARVARAADEAGFDSIWVMDHFFQIRGLGAVEDPMLEGWTTLGFLAAQTSRARLGLMVGGVHYRLPGLWVKAATTLDVLSGGRAWLGIGAAWNREESDGLGFPMPPLGTRFEMLEETLQIAHAMWTGERGTEGRHMGRHYAATRLLNSPQAISQPRVPIMIGGGGEKKTLRLVARYGDATNVFGGPETLRRKYAILRAHCEAVGRPFAEIERTTLQGTLLTADGGPRTETPEAAAERFAALAEAGAQHVIVEIQNAEQPGVDALAERLATLTHAIPTT